MSGQLTIHGRNEFSYEFQGFITGKEECGNAGYNKYGLTHFDLNTSISYWASVLLQYK